MDVAVAHKRVQRRLRPARLSVLGDGLLERARSTSLALLGLSAAVGLGMVALALNQGWPPVAASPIPDPPVSAIDDRVAVARPSPPAAGPSPPGSAQAPATHLPSAEVETDDPPIAPSPRSTEGATVAPSPSSGGGSDPTSPPDRSEKPVAQPAAPPPTPAPAPTPVSAPDPAPAESASEPEPEPAFPEATASSHPGQGHAHGKGSGNGPPEGVPPGHAGR